MFVIGSLLGWCVEFLLNPFLAENISWIGENLIYTYFVGGVVGAMIIDFAYSIHLATKLKEFKDYRDLRFEEFKKN